MAINEYYIDAGGGSDSSGDGSLGNPWATLRYAFVNATNRLSSYPWVDPDNSGVRFWLHGTDSVSLALPSGNLGYSSPAQPIRIQGWDKLSTGERYPGIIVATTPLGSHNTLLVQYSRHYAFEMHNIELIDACIRTGDYAVISNCYLRSTATDKHAGFYLGRGSAIINCEVAPSPGAGFTGTGIAGGGFNSAIKSGLVHGCLFTDSNLIYDTDEDKFIARQSLLYCGEANVNRNIFVMTGNSINSLIGTAIRVDQGMVDHNSILCTTGTATESAIKIEGWPTSGNASFGSSVSCTNNIVEGYGTQKAFELSDAARVSIVAGNAAYNNGTDFDLTGFVTRDRWNAYILNPTTPVIELDNESLSSSPFTKSGAITFANRFTYFALNNVGNVLGGAYNGQGALDKGAVQTPSVTTIVGGSDMLTNPGMAGGMRG